MTQGGIKDQYIPCTRGCITARGVPTRHRGKNNCPRLRKERIQHMNLNDNSIHGVNSAANQETESAPLNESASSNVDLAVILPPVPLPTNISELNPPSPIPLPEHQRLDIPDTPQTPTPQSSCRPRGSPVRAPIMQALDEIPSLEDKVSEKSSSNIRKDPPDTKNNTPRKRKKVKLTLENAEYQKDEQTRDTYYRTISQRLRDRTKKFGHLYWLLHI
jgi:hypothetical protein